MSNVCENEITVKQAEEMLKHLQKVFDVVRFVNPLEHKELVFTKDGVIREDSHNCFGVWNKSERCDNCVSMKAQREGCRGTKYEFNGDNVFQVLVTPFTIENDCGSKIETVLELVNKATDEITFEAFGKTELIEKINAMNKKIYEDSLTKVHNRRYFDEKIFCYAGDSNLKENVTFIMIDLNKFKDINDNYGHDVGDWVLLKVGEAFKSSLRSSDMVIRIGGDEFLVILKNCLKENVPCVVEKMRQAIGKIVYDKEKNLNVTADLGWVFTEEFTPTDDFVAKLLNEADKKMYEEKRNKR